MRSTRPFCLCVQLPYALTLGVCLVCVGALSAMPQAGQAPATPPPNQQPPPGQQQQPPKQPNPFENVPEAPQQPQQPQQQKSNAGLIEDIQFRGQRRIPQDTLRA